MLLGKGHRKTCLMQSGHEPSVCKNKCLWSATKWSPVRQVSRCLRHVETLLGPNTIIFPAGTLPGEGVRRDAKKISPSSVFSLTENHKKKKRKRSFSMTMSPVFMQVTVNFLKKNLQRIQLQKAQFHHLQNYGYLTPLERDRIHQVSLSGIHRPSHKHPPQLQLWPPHNFMWER